MTKRNKIGIPIAIIIIVIAAAIIYNTLVRGVPKDQWINNFKADFPASFCQAILNDKRLNKNTLPASLTQEKCISLIPSAFDKCIDQYSAMMPPKINAIDGRKWGGKLGECTGKVFYIMYLAGVK